MTVSFAAFPAAAAPNARPMASTINSEAASTEAVSISKPVSKPVRKVDNLAARPVTPATKPITASRTQGAPIERVQMASLPPATTRAPKEAAPAERPVRETAISIRASEPEFAPSVRPSDVQGFQKIGAPYQVNGTWYIPTHEPDYNEVGTASWYGRDFHGKSTANGELFDMNIVSAAHPTLPIPSLVEVTNLTNGRSMVVRVNDRGPFVADRLIDLSARGAELLGYREQGSTQVRVRYIGPADPEPVVTNANLTAPGEEKKWTKPTPSPVQTATTTRVAEQKPARPMKPTTVNTDDVASGLYVQAGAFSRRANAERALAQAAEIGQAKIVETETASGASLYRILIGPVQSQSEAAALAKAVSGQGVSGAHIMASRD
ncbi:MAG: septal ring lytic transglycosylase RlpA family protein [Hyphomonadaceae bacterium]|nr:septal ring lytic transglycosylase RlpA family protein [Hyphomonadaceae bacterium]